MRTACQAGMFGNSFLIFLTCMIVRPKFQFLRNGFFTFLTCVFVRPSFKFLSNSLLIFWNCLIVRPMFSKNRPSGPILSIIQSVCPCVRLFTFEVLFNVFLSPLPKVRCTNFLEIWNPCGNVMERSGLRFENFNNKGCKISVQNKLVFRQILPY